MHEQAGYCSKGNGADMSLPGPKITGHTIDEWKTWDGRWEPVNGVAYDMTPAPGAEHQRTSVRLTVAIFNALEEAKRKAGGGGCEVFSAPIDLFLPGQESVYQPDLVEAARIEWGSVAPLLGGKLPVTLG
jgi:hypothetical protein